MTTTRNTNTKQLPSYLEEALQSVESMATTYLKIIEAYNEKGLFSGRYVIDPEKRKTATEKLLAFTIALRETLLDEKAVLSTDHVNDELQKIWDSAGRQLNEKIQFKKSQFNAMIETAKDKFSKIVEVEQETRARIDAFKLENKLKLEELDKSWDKSWNDAIALITKADQKNLTNQLKNALKENDEAHENEKQKLREQFDTAQTNLTQKEEQIKQLNTELTEKKKKIEQLNTALTEKEKQLLASKEQVPALLNENLELADTIKQLNTKLTIEEEQTKQLNTKLTAEEEQTKQLNTKLTQREGQLVTSQEQSSEWVTTISNQETIIKHLTNTAHQQAATINDLEKTIELATGATGLYESVLQNRQLETAHKTLSKSVELLLDLLSSSLSVFKENLSLLISPSLLEKVEVAVKTLGKRLEKRAREEEEKIAKIVSLSENPMTTFAGRKVHKGTANIAPPNNLPSLYDLCLQKLISTRLKSR